MKNFIKIIILFTLLTQCRAPGDSKNETSFLLLRLLMNNSRITLYGNANLSGTIKNANVSARSIPTSGPDAGKCDGLAGYPLASGMTSAGDAAKNNGGDYSLNIEKPSNNSVCIVVSPSSESTTYAPLKKNSVPWKPSIQSAASANQLVAVVTLSSANTKSAQPANVNPISSMSAGRFTQSLKDGSGARRLAFDSSMSGFISDKSEELNTSARGKAVENIRRVFFTKLPRNTDFEMVDLDDPNNREIAKQMKAVSGGFDKIVDNIKTSKGYSDNDVDDLFSKYIGFSIADIQKDGKFDGKGFTDDDGAEVTFDSSEDFYNIITSPVEDLKTGMTDYMTWESTDNYDDGSGWDYVAGEYDDPEYTGSALSDGSYIYYVFTTTDTYTGDFGSVYDADTICNADPKNDFGGYFMAMLASADGARQACDSSPNCSTTYGSESIDWVFYPQTTYYNEEWNIIGTTNDDYVFTFPLDASFGMSGGTNTYWTGMGNNWISTTNTSESCDSWYPADSSTELGLVGVENSTTNTSISNGDTGIYCNDPKYLLCVEQ